MLVRMFEYDAQIALNYGNIIDSTLTIHFPNSAVLYLRSSLNTPNIMCVKMVTPSGELTYPIPVMKMKDYSLEEIFAKKLLFLIPFYIFVHESKFAVYNKDKDKLILLLQEYEDIKNRLEALCFNREISEFTRQVILDMSNKVLEHIAKNYQEIQKGVKSVMGG